MIKGFFKIGLQAFLILIITLISLNYLTNSPFKQLHEQNADSILDEEYKISKLISKNSKLVFNKEESYATVVSMYFPLNKSKHNLAEYEIWNRNALLSIECPLILFTTSEMKKEYLKLRRHNVIFYIYENHWELFKEVEKNRNMSYIDSYMNKQFDIDPDQKYHVKDLYVIWNSKAYIMDKMARLNPFNSSFFFYSDLGSWRWYVIPNWPDMNFVKIVNKHLKGRILFGQTAQVDNETAVEILGDFIEGTFYAGSPQSIISYAKLFYDVHDKRFKEGLFVGKDQTIMNYIAYKTEPKNYVRLRTLEMHVCNENQTDKNNYYDLWFFYQQYFSSTNFFKCNYEKKLSILTNI